MMLWQYKESDQDKLIAARLNKYGRILRKLESPNSRLYTFDHHGIDPPLVAKGIYLDPEMDPKYQKIKISKAL